MIYLHEIASVLRYFPAQDGDIVDLQSVRVKPEGAPDSAYVQVISDYKGLQGADHYWEFPGAEDIIRASLEKRNIPIAEISVIYIIYPPSGAGGSSDTDSFTVLFTGARLLMSSVTAGQLCRNRFLHTGTAAWLMPGQSFSLCYYSESNPNQIGLGTASPMTVYRTYRNGSSEQFTIQTDTDAGLKEVEFEYLAAVAFDVVTFGLRTFCFYYIDAPVVEIFSFRNVFNLLETISVPAAVTEEPDTDFDTARLNNVLVRYDVEHNRTFTLTTATLPPFMYTKLLELCQARQVLWRTFLTDSLTQSRDIIITEYKINKSTAPDTPLSLTLKFRFADTTLNDAANLY